VPAHRAQGRGRGAGRDEGAGRVHLGFELIANRSHSGKNTAPRCLFFFLMGRNWRFLWPFRRLMPVNPQSRTESNPGALRSFCGSGGEAPPNAQLVSSLALHAAHLRHLAVPRPVPAASCGCSCSCAFITGCMMHELSTELEVDTAAHASPPFSSAFVPWGRGGYVTLIRRCGELCTKREWEEHIL
jgi:hypothetical protein